VTNVPRKHHYVPKVLLRGFTASGTSEGQLHIVDLLRRTTYASTPEGAAKETDYNLVESEGVDPFAIEHDLLANTVEGPAASGLDLLRRGELPGDDDRERLLSFIAMQALRAPARREMLDDFSTRAARMALSLAFESDETLEAARRSDPELADLTREEAQEFIRNAVIRDNPTGHLANLLPSFGPILDQLVLRSWALLVAPDGVDFVCSDDPVVIVPVRRPSWSPGSFASHGAARRRTISRRAETSVPDPARTSWLIIGEAPATKTDPVKPLAVTQSSRRPPSTRRSRSVSSSRCIR
jgi:hypothetical protein